MFKCYFDKHDWWIGAYLGPWKRTLAPTKTDPFRTRWIRYLYVCPLPCLVVRIEWLWQDAPGARIVGSNLIPFNRNRVKKGA